MISSGDIGRVAGSGYGEKTGATIVCLLRRLSFLTRFTFFLFMLLFSQLLVPATNYSKEYCEVKGVRYDATPEYLRVFVDLSGPVEFTRNRLTDPERLYFDLKNTMLTKGLKTGVPGIKGFLKVFRVAQYTATTVRIVFDLERTDYEVRVSNPEDPPQLIIDLTSRRFNEDLSGTKANSGFLKRKIVIDPGHGGEDPGAIGPNGLYEKDVVLDIALNVRDIIKEAYPGYEVILTRDSDVFIPLEKRAAIANRANADLFVSIHANASNNRQARGIETYLLNWTNDMEAMRVAARENAISLKKMQQVQNELGLILASLERESKRDQSIKLSGNIQRSLTTTICADYPKVANHGVKQALFYVLVGARMPSALVEVSFISNWEEEQLLSEPGYRKKIAASIVSGITDYFDSTPPLKVASGGVVQQ
ncbi:MAG: N-acetylmuramoyl-L-alanine amidase [Dissulfurispiraceae bacterium]